MESEALNALGIEDLNFVNSIELTEEVCKIAEAELELEEGNDKV